MRVPVVLFLLRCTCCAPTAAVIGAGEHGILAAVELQNRGYDVTVFEKEASAIPIANTVQLDGIYDYLSAAVLPSGNLNGSGTIKSLATLAFKYNQSLDFLPAGLVSNFRSFDSVEGVTVYPPTWKSLLGDRLCRCNLKRHTV